MLRLFGFLGILVLTGCTAGRMIVYQFSDIKDYKKFPSRPLEAPNQPFLFAEDPGYLKAHNIRVTHQGHRYDLDEWLPNTPTVAFLVIRNDSILYENYFNKYERESIVASFSSAKSFVSALVGFALQDGKILSVEDSMTHYLTELQGKGLGGVKIRHLLQMTSGIHHAENYFNPFAGVAKLYYGHNIRRQVLHLKPEYKPGFYFKYRSIDTQLLGLVVERATGQSLTSYMQEKIWTPLGMESDASWSIDRKKNGIEKAYCCINAIGRDFAKFGRLYLNEGNWNGTQLLPAEWVQKSTEVNTDEGSAWYYQYQWWLASREGEYFAEGHLGQFIYVNPKKKTVIVRLGKNYGDVTWVEVFREIASQL